MEAKKDPHSYSSNFHLIEQGLSFDFSKHLIDQSHFEKWSQLCASKGVEAGIQAMFSGQPINKSENRQVLHTLLRTSSLEQVEDSLYKKWRLYTGLLDEMEAWRHKIKTGTFCGATGKRFTNIVHIGIGGSDLGPKLVADFFTSFKSPDLSLHFISNLDPIDWEVLSRNINWEETLVIVVSKSFSTLETLENAKVAKSFLEQSAIGKNWAQHMFAISSNVERVTEFGLKEQHILPMDEAIGGRFSVWSTVSFSIILAFGLEMFQSFLSGAEAMDRHFKTRPVLENIPVVMALLDDFYRNEKDMRALSVMPYSSALTHLCGYLQQLCMESNGKSVTNANGTVSCKTGPIIFGQIGTDAQHMYAQWLHQGTDIIPTDFIGFKKSIASYGDHQALLLANMKAQAQALFEGEKNEKEPYRNFDGGRPSSTILFDEFSVYNLGMLLACYEHRVYVQSLLWDINAFDQWGVELGKKVARDIYETSSN